MNDLPRRPWRVNVIGTSGSGKSCFSRKLAQALSAPYIEMDQLFWLPDWQQRPDEDFFAHIKAATTGTEWVLDGNYTRSQAVKWQNVNLVIWLDYSFPRTCFQALKRACKRILSNKELWPGTGNRESFRRTFLSHESVVLWTLQTYFVNKKRYPLLPQQPLLQKVHFVRVNSPKQANALITQLSKQMQSTP